MSLPRFRGDPELVRVEVQRGMSTVPRTKPPYHPEFRAQAVELVKSSGKPIRQIAADLGVSSWSLGNWVRQAQVDAGEREGLTTDELQELKRLRREVWLLREEREILKKVTHAPFRCTAQDENQECPTMPLPSVAGDRACLVSVSP